MDALSPDIIKKHRGKSFVGISTGVAIFNQKGELFLAKRSVHARDEHGRWDVCGGGLEFGLGIEQNVRQEMLEEFNITTDQPLHFLRYIEAFRTDESGAQTHWVSFGYFLFLTDEDVKRVTINEPDKFVEMGWFALDKLPSPLHSLINDELIELLDTAIKKHLTSR